MQKEKSTRRFHRRSYSRVFSSFFEETFIPKKDLCRNCKADMDYAKSIEDWLFCKICDQDALDFIFLTERFLLVQFVLF